MNSPRLLKPIGSAWTVELTKLAQVGLPDTRMAEGQLLATLERREFAQVQESLTQHKGEASYLQ